MVRTKGEERQKSKQIKKQNLVTARHTHTHTPHACMHIYTHIKILVKFYGYFSVHRKSPQFQNPEDSGFKGVSFIS